MREVKFRVWDKKKKEYIVPEKFEILLLSSDRETPVYKINLNNNIYDFYKAENIEVEMFTGLKDKYEKDIYEGDIVYSFNSRLIQHYDSEIEPEYDEMDGIVIFEDGNFKLENLFGETKNTYLSIYSFEEFEEFEVVGNIHENKEFLK